MMIVAKFGGSSLKNVEAFKQVKNIIKNKKNIKIIVLSAIGDTTNLLMKIFESTKISQSKIIDKLISRNKEIATNLGFSRLTVNRLINNFKKELLFLENTILNSKTLDKLLSLGEQFSTALMVEFLKKNNIRVKLVDARNLIITDNNFGKARPQLTYINHRCKKYITPLLKDYIVVTQGFIGSTKDNITTTLGRGGSDYSAALIAEALNADLLEIYTDVQGLHSGDPRIVNNAKYLGNCLSSS